MTANLITVDELQTELGAARPMALLERAVADASGIARDYCGHDFTLEGSAEPIVPPAVRRAVLMIATLIIYAIGRDPTLIQETTEGLGSHRWGTASYASVLPLLDPWRRVMIA